MAILAGLSDEAVLAVYADEARSRRDRELAFHELVTRYQHRVFAVCTRVLGGSADAEDAVQEVFIRLARHAASFRGESKLSTWLYRVASNVATDLVRHDARRPSVPVDDITAVADEPEADDLVGARETALTVEDALGHLDPLSRTLLLLVAVDGLSYAEAAAAHDLPVGTVKSRVSRARVQLGELLAALEADHLPASSGAGVVGPTGGRPRDLDARGPPFDGNPDRPDDVPPSSHPERTPDP